MVVLLDNTCNFVLLILKCYLLTVVHSIFSEDSYSKNNTPPMPLHDAHLGGFFFYSFFAHV